MSTATTASTRHIVTESLGPLTLVQDDGGLTGLYFRGHWTRPDRSAFGPRADLERKRHLLELEGAIQPAAEPLW